MSAGTNRKYKTLDIRGRHFVETGRATGMSKSQIRAAAEEVIAAAPDAANRVLLPMPSDLTCGIHDGIARAMLIVFRASITPWRPDDSQLAHCYGSYVWKFRTP